MPHICDHTWILLTTQEYERPIFNFSAWSVRGCTLCGEIEKEIIDPDLPPLETWVKVDVSVSSFIDTHNEYFKRLRLFAVRP